MDTYHQEEGLVLYGAVRRHSRGFIWSRWSGKASLELRLEEGWSFCAEGRMVHNFALNWDHTENQAGRQKHLCQVPVDRSVCWAHKATCGCRVSTPALAGMALSEKNTIWYLQEDQPAGCGSWSFRGLRVPSLLITSARKWMHKYYCYISRFASS